MRTCEYHEDGKLPVCGIPAIARYMGAFVCECHAEISKRKWGEEHLKPYRPRKQARKKK